MSSSVVHLFEENGKYYCYDPYANKLLLLTKNHYIEVKKLTSCGKEEYLAQAKDAEWGTPTRDIAFLLNTGRYFADQLFVESSYPDREALSDVFLNSIHDLALQVTRNCNFSCRYCQYSTPNCISRVHENEKMSEEVAYKAVDFLMAHSADSELVNIAFCGGEPLLNVNLVLKVMRYCQDCYPFQNVTYNLTTNASLLRDEQIKEFKKNNLQLMISFDGPQKVQDYNRKFRSDGMGTFDQVLGNIQNLMKKHRSYFEKNVTFNAVYLNLEQKRMAEDYFGELKILNRTRLVDADLRGIDYRVDHFIPHSKQDQALDHVDLRTLDWYKNREKQFVNGSEIPQKWHHGGPCVPGIRRLFVDTKGVFSPCEKAIETEALSIGSLSEGIDVEAALNLLNIGDLTADDCKHCFAFRFCSICCSHCVDPEKKKITKTCKEKECQNQKEIADLFLRKYVHNRGV